MNRRDFLKLTASGIGSALATSSLLRAQGLDSATKPPKGAATVGMPISIDPLVAGDLDRLFGDMRERAGVNALFPFIATYEAHRAGLPAAGFRGGNYAIPHMQYYKDTLLDYGDLRAPEIGEVDVFARAIPAAHKAGIKMFAWIIEDNNRPMAIPHWEQLYEVDVHGRRAKGHPGGPCNNNPYYRGYLRGLVEDYARSYAIDGIMWGSERQGGLLTALGISQSGSPSDPGKVTCFCDFCQKRGKESGIDVERARSGFLAVEAYVRSARTGKRPADGYFSAFWRILLEYPEVLAWENLWVKGRHDLEAELYRTAKSINPELQVGWHIWHNVSFSPFQRAEEDYGILKGFSDFIRPALYNNSAGERMREFVKGSRSGVFGDLSSEQALELFYSQMGYKEAPIESVGQTGLSADYVKRETKRAVDGVSGTKTQIWPGIDIDVPLSDPTSKATTAEGVKAAVRAVFDAGATGIILSRNYVEMKPEHLSAAGDQLRELKLIG